MSAPREGAAHATVDPRVLGRKLRNITESLAAALAGARDPEPDWSDLEWGIARAVAVIHGISPLLSKHLGWRGPPGWRDFLEGQWAHTAGRYRRMASLVASIDALAAQAAIAFIPLKGEALHAIGLYAAGDRPMADIDLLLAPADLAPMARMLTGLGYRPICATADECVLVPADRPALNHFGEHTDNGITIELHAKIGRPMPVRSVDITAQLWPAAPRPGRNEYPSLSALMSHLLLHAAVNMQMRILRMLQLHDIALLAPRLSAADWNELLHPGGEPTGCWWAMPPLQLTARYYPGSIPAAAIEDTRTGCAALLRFVAPRLRVSDVSASNVRRATFPALSWVGSLPEAVSCVSARLQSGVRALRGDTAMPQATELQPWITPSHRRRVLEVLLGRPRPEALRVVAAALDSELAVAPAQARRNAA
jgi:putative nucleotidyltransferase-like protein